MPVFLVYWHIPASQLYLIQTAWFTFRLQPRPCWNKDAGEQETGTFQVKLKESQSTARRDRWLYSSKKRDRVVELISATACSAFPTICILNADFPVVTYTFITSRLRLLPTHPRWDSIWGAWHDWSRVRYLTAMCWCQCTSDSSDWAHLAAEVEGADQDLHCLTWQKSIPPKKLF